MTNAGRVRSEKARKRESGKAGKRGKRESGKAG
ncbi:hypothetical protein VII00023_00675, partial [Vibrio ichthyoenteri ATCC 700023]